jgi:hypothetical protein
VTSADLVRISYYIGRPAEIVFDRLATDLVTAVVGFLEALAGIGRTYGTLTDRLCLQNPEFLAGYQCSLRVAVERQRKNKAIGTRSPEKLLPLSSHFIQFSLYALDSHRIPLLIRSGLPNGSFFGHLQHQMIIQPVLGYPCIADIEPESSRDSVFSLMRFGKGALNN